MSKMYDNSGDNLLKSVILYAGDIVKSTDGTRSAILLYEDETCTKKVSFERLRELYLKHMLIVSQSDTPIASGATNLIPTIGFESPDVNGEKTVYQVIATIPTGNPQMPVMSCYYHSDCLEKE